jgi:hypothetical protein
MRWFVIKKNKKQKQKGEKEFQKKKKKNWGRPMFKGRRYILKKK